MVGIPWLNYATISSVQESLTYQIGDITRVGMQHHEHRSFFTTNMESDKVKVLKKKMIVQSNNSNK